MRRLILYIATSVDGFIAGEGGSVSWLDQFSEEGGLPLPAFLTSQRAQCLFSNAITNVPSADRQANFQYQMLK